MKGENAFYKVQKKDCYSLLIYWTYASLKNEYQSRKKILILKLNHLYSMLLYF